MFSVSVFSRFGQRVDTEIRIKNKEAVIQSGRHMYRPKVTQAPPVSPVYSISPSLSRRPAFGMTAQCQELDSGQETMPGLLPGGFEDQWRELGPFLLPQVSHSKLSLCTIGALCVWRWAEAGPCLMLALSQL